jgi:hypothetical protein
MTGAHQLLALRPVAWSIIFLAAPGCIGCGGSGGPEKKRVYAVKGVLSMDGQPYGPAQLLVYPTETTPTGQPAEWFVGRADDKGELAFMTYEQNDGLPAGEYRVMISGFSQQKPVPNVYQNRASPLIVRIEPKKNEVKVDMDSEADEKAEEEAAKREGRKYIPKEEREKLKKKMMKKR